MNMLLIQERAVKSGHFSYTTQTEFGHLENTGYFEPDALEELNRKGRLYVITDGVWGTAAGSVASQYTIRKILHDFYRQAVESNPEKRLAEVIQKTNRSIYEWNQQHTGRRPLATTIMAALLHQGQLIISNVGDGQAYVIWEKVIESILPPATTDHLQTGLGLINEIPLELFSRRMRAGERVILCSGGLSGYLTQNEMLEIVSRLSPTEASRQLTDLARERGCRDHLAVSILEILDQPVTQTPPTRTQLPPPPSWESLLKLPAKPKPARAVPKIKSDIPLSENNVNTPPRTRWLVAVATVFAILFCVGGVGFASWQYQQTNNMGGISAIVEAGSVASIASTPTPIDAVAFVIPATNTATPTSNPIEAAETAVEANSVADETSPNQVAESIVEAINEAEPTAVTPPTVAATPRATVELPPGCANGARYYDDLTIPDGSEIVAGTQFDKAWQMQNNGSCPWAPGYTIRFLSGDVMHEQSEFIVPMLQPNVITAVSIPMLAPTTPGLYSSNWQIHDLNGQPFGANLSVEIQVVPPEPGTVVEPASQTVLYDFIAQADQATWLSTGVAAYQLQEARIDSSLVVPAPVGLVVRGVAELRGRRDSAGPVLLTHPHQEIGLIEGSYEVDRPLEPTDSLVVTLGFPQAALLNDDGATYELLFMPNGGTEQLILSETVGYRDSPISQRIPLTGISSGQTGTFILRVSSGKSTAFDWALWIDARLVRESS